MTLPEALARADNLPSLPAVAVEILRLSRDENAGLEDYATTVSSDPVLALRLLKLANSSLFSVGHEVSTIERAIMVLGMKTVQLMTLSFSLVSSLPQEGGEEFDYGEFWRRSLTAAVSAREIGNLFRSEVANEAFLGGLLSGIGQLAMARCLPEQYGEVLARCDEWPESEHEREVLGYDHLEVGAALLESWEMPRAFSQGIAHMEDPTALPDDATEVARELVQLLHIADLTVRVLHSDGQSAALARLQRLLADNDRGLSLTEILELLEREIDETARLLSIEAASATSTQELIEQARQRVIHIGLGTAVDLQSVSRQAEELEEQNAELRDRASTDELTGLANRSSFDRTLEQEVRARIGGSGSPLGLLLLDIDHFKRFNDTHGHPAGDAVLRAVGSVLRGMTRSSDVAARYGGEELAIIAPEAAAPGLRIFAERVRRAIEELRVEHDGASLAVTASIGGAYLTQAAGPRDAKRLVALADRFLYRAKSAGRNGYEICPQELPPGG